MGGGWGWNYVDVFVGIGSEVDGGAGESHAHNANASEQWKLIKHKTNNTIELFFFGIAPGSGVEGGVGERGWLLKSCVFFHMIWSILTYFEVVWCFLKLLFMFLAIFSHSSRFLGYPRGYTGAEGVLRSGKTCQATATTHKELLVGSGNFKSISNNIRYAKHIKSEKRFSWKCRFYVTRSFKANVATELQGFPIFSIFGNNKHADHLKSWNAIFWGFRHFLLDPTTKLACFKCFEFCSCFFRKLFEVFSSMLTFVLYFYVFHVSWFSDLSRF